MAKVSPVLEEKKDIFLYSTEIDNLFISEFVPDAPGEYIKVYLFGLMYARYGQDFDSRRLSNRLGMSEEELEEACIYWESRGLVKIIRKYNEDNEPELQVVFKSQIEALYGRSEGNEEISSSVQPGAGTEADDEEVPDEDLPLYISIDDMEFDDVVTDRLIDTELRDLYEKYASTTGHTVSRQEASRIEDTIRQDGVAPEIFGFAIDYCADIGKDSINYIITVARRWTEDGCRTVEDAKKLLEKHSRRNDYYRQVFRAIGFNRLPAPADREIMDRWFDGLGCTIEEVLDACAAAAGLRDPNLRYVNKVIENRRMEKGGINTRSAGEARRTSADAPAEAAGASPVSRKVLADYFDHIREQDDKVLEARVEEVLRKVPEMRASFNAENSVNKRMLSLRPGAENLDARQRLRTERIAIEENKKRLLTENGFPADYLTRKYRCAVCRDTGYTDEGMVCSCCRERAAEAYKWHTGKEKA